MASYSYLPHAPQILIKIGCQLLFISLLRNSVNCYTIHLNIFVYTMHLYEETSAH